MPTRVQAPAWFVVVGLLASFPAAAQDRTARDVVDQIVREGPQAQAIRAASDVVRREQLARLALPNPAVTYSREGAGFTEFLQVEQPLPLFGTRAALSRAGVAATAAAEAERDARLWDLRAEAALTVVAMTTEQARAEAADAHARRVERLVEILGTREREGEGSRFDRLRAEQEQRDARQQITDAAVALAGARSRVMAMLPPGAGLGRVVPASPTAPPADALDVLIARALSARPELRVLRHTAQRADEEADAARRARLPSPVLFGGLKRADDASGRERGGVFGVGLSLPLFDTGKRDAARWAAERTRAEAERAAIEHRIRAEVALAAETLALRQTAAGEDADSAGDELLRIAEVAYTEGDAGILDLLDAFRTAARARLRTIELRRDERLAQVALERAVGDVLWP